MIITFSYLEASVKAKTIIFIVEETIKSEAPLNIVLNQLVQTRWSLWSSWIICGKINCFVYGYIISSRLWFLVLQKVAMYKKEDWMCSDAFLSDVHRIKDNIKKTLVFYLCFHSLHNQNVDEIHQNQGERFPPENTVEIVMNDSEVGIGIHIVFLNQTYQTTFSSYMNCSRKKGMRKKQFKNGKCVWIRLIFQVMDSILTTMRAEIDKV